jgi:hypothetical protein
MTAPPHRCKLTAAYPDPEAFGGDQVSVVTMRTGGLATNGLPLA